MASRTGLYFCKKDCRDRAYRDGVIKPKPRKRNYPIPGNLFDLVWDMPVSKIAKLYNVSDIVVHRWCKLRGINKPPHGFWLRKDRPYGSTAEQHIGNVQVQVQFPLGALR